MKPEQDAGGSAPADPAQPSTRTCRGAGRPSQLANIGARGRMGRPEDMVGAAAFLASADADYIVAQTLSVDDGNWMS